MKKVRILISPNSYKGVASSVEAADYFEKYLSKAKDVELIKKPVTDGGDGFLDVCKINFGLQIFKIDIPAPFVDETIKCRLGYDEKSETIYIESADILGMKIIPPQKRRPVNLNSYGLGILLMILNKKNLENELKINRVVIGIGGTGTNDLGLGAASAFGIRILDKNGNALNPFPATFNLVEDIRVPKIQLSFKLITVTDVVNPLTGRHGATRMFGKQKGSSDEEIELIEKGFARIIKILKRKNYIKRSMRLNGSGGGLAAGLKIFFGASQITASSFVLNYLGLKKYKNNIDYVISGEGFFDEQSLMKKAAGVIIDFYVNSSVKIFLCCGIIDAAVLKKAGAGIIPIEFISFWKTKEKSLSLFEESIIKSSKKILYYINKTRNELEEHPKQSRFKTE